MLVKCALAALAIGSVLCGVCGGGPPAHATLVEISGSGTWSASTPTTPESAPGESFSYSFDIPNPYTGTAFPPPPATQEGLETTQATNLVYDLNGSPVSVGLGIMVVFNSSFGEAVRTYIN